MSRPAPPGRKGRGGTTKKKSGGTAAMNGLDQPEIPVPAPTPMQATAPPPAPAPAAPTPPPAPVPTPAVTPPTATPAASKVPVPSVADATQGAASQPSTGGGSLSALAWLMKASSKRMVLQLFEKCHELRDAPEDVPIAPIAAEFELSETEAGQLVMTLIKVTSAATAATAADAVSLIDRDFPEIDARLRDLIRQVLEARVPDWQEELASEGLDAEEAAAHQAAFEAAAKKKEADLAAEREKLAAERAALEEKRRRRMQFLGEAETEVDTLHTQLQDKASAVQQLDGNETSLIEQGLQELALEREAKLRAEREAAEEARRVKEAEEAAARAAAEEVARAEREMAERRAQEEREEQERKWKQEEELARFREAEEERARMAKEAERLELENLAKQARLEEEHSAEQARREEIRQQSAGELSLFQDAMEPIKPAQDRDAGEGEGEGGALFGDGDADETRDAGSFDFDGATRRAAEQKRLKEEIRLQEEAERQMLKEAQAQDPFSSYGATGGGGGGAAPAANSEEEDDPFGAPPSSYAAAPTAAVPAAKAYSNDPDPFSSYSPTDGAAAANTSNTAASGMFDDEEDDPFAPPPSNGGGGGGGGASSGMFDDEEDDPFGPAVSGSEVYANTNVRGLHNDRTYHTSNPPPKPARPASAQSAADGKGEAWRQTHKDITSAIYAYGGVFSCTMYGTADAVDFDTGQTYTEYILRCTWGTSIEVAKPWMVARRFREFYALDSILREAFPHLADKMPSLPSKSLFGSLAPETVKTRQQQLEKYMSRIISTEALSAIVKSPQLDEFLMISDRIKQIRGDAGQGTGSGRSIATPVGVDVGGGG
eukprot:CAMPEP_0119478570 /NCGR_PEP_ID=MMETSP1344-20130328/8243_1 /TAXON_ID=236787 /ORGANISM="Florenciella parvula, Strain CCMP2471" /LENGTH=830 /DNA_ID=CAMNT_0007512749 /DNA_START=97 /DNA_END=2585 /DNA_ORIENTATION=+